ncbi:hypothetical protein BJX64DRAFT_137540 [Aspergillus heterothallicus]
MGGWEIFCAICGGPFSSQVDMDCEGTDEMAYRYDVLEDCNLDWLNKLQALGINPDAPASNNSFITGIGRYFDYGGVEVVAGDHPNIPFPTNEVVPMVAYHDFSDIGERHVFPFHPVCYEILDKCIHAKQVEETRGDLLYNVFEEINGGQYVRLQLDYGDPDPPSGQVWETTRGQEVLVVNPLNIPALESLVADIKNTLNIGADVDETTCPSDDDIFTRLPIELRHEIFHHLPPESILAVKATSTVMHATHLSRSVWGDKLADAYPWLWEVDGLPVFETQELEESVSEILRICRDATSHTETRDGYMLGLVNRRRIWGVCEQIREMYLDELARLV